MVAESGWGEPAPQDPPLEIKNGRSVTCAGTTLLTWTDADEDPITSVGQNRTTWADQSIEAFCFTTEAGNVLVAIRPPEASSPDCREIRCLPLMGRAQRAELVVGNTEVRLVVEVAGEPLAGYDICGIDPVSGDKVRDIDPSTIRVSFDRRSDGPSAWPGRQDGSATLLTPREASSPKPLFNVGHEEDPKPPEWRLVELTVLEKKDVLPLGTIRKNSTSRQWGEKLNVPEEQRIRMPIVAERLKKFWTEHPLAPVIDRLKQQAMETDHDLFIVGGAVRDAILDFDEGNDLDLAGDVPPSMFRYWVRTIAADIDMDLLARTSPTNVTRIGIRDADTVRWEIEYALFKYQLAGKRWTGCNDLTADYLTRDLAENSLLYSLKSEQIVTASPEVERWLSGDAPEGHIDKERYGEQLTAITIDSDNGQRLHKDLGPWAPVNLLARLMKSYSRMERGHLSPDPAKTARTIKGLYWEILSSIENMAQAFGVAPEHVVAAAILEANSKSPEYRRSAAIFLQDTLAQVIRDGKYSPSKLTEWMSEAITLTCGSSSKSAEWVDPVDLQGRGLAKAVLNSKDALTIDPDGLQMLTWFTPAQVSLKLGALVSCWKQTTLPIQHNGQQMWARAYENPRVADTYLVEVDVIDNQPIEVPPPAEGKASG